MRIVRKIDREHALFKARKRRTAHVETNVLLAVKGIHFFLTRQRRIPDRLFPGKNKLDVNVGAMRLQFCVAERLGLIALNQRKKFLSLDLDATVRHGRPVGRAQKFKRSMKTGVEACVTRSLIKRIDNHEFSLMNETNPGIARCKTRQHCR